MKCAADVAATAGASTTSARMTLGQVGTQASLVTLKIPAPIRIPSSAAYDSMVPRSRRRPDAIAGHGSTAEKARTGSQSAELRAKRGVNRGAAKLFIAAPRVIPRCARNERRGPAANDVRDRPAVGPRETTEAPPDPKHSPEDGERHPCAHCKSRAQGIS